MCDLVDISPGHNCFEFDTLKIKSYEVCGKKTCGWTRVTTCHPLDFIGCIECSNKISSLNEHLDKWKKMVQENKKKKHKADPDMIAYQEFEKRTSA